MCGVVTAVADESGGTRRRTAAAGMAANLRVAGDDLAAPDDGPQCYARVQKKDSDARRRRGWTVVIGRELR